MATYARNTDLTIGEVLKHKGPDGNILNLTNILTENNPFLYDLPWIAANGVDQHKTLVTANLQTGSTRRYNQGVAPNFSSVQPEFHTIEKIAAMTKVDREILRDQPNAAAVVDREARAKMEGMTQTLADRILYGNNSTNPDQMTGIATRLGTIDSKFVVNAGGTGSDVSSLYIIQPGEGQVYCVYPMNASKLITREELGYQVSTDSNGLEMQYFREEFMWKAGFVIEDPRCAARIANIETTGTTNIFDYSLVNNVLVQMKNMGQGAVIYASRLIYAQIRQAAVDKANAAYGWSDVFGRDTVTIMGVPIRPCHAILDTETAIS